MPILFIARSININQFFSNLRTRNSLGYLMAQVGHQIAQGCTDQWFNRSSISLDIHIPAYSSQSFSNPLNSSYSDHTDGSRKPVGLLFPSGCFYVISSYYFLLLITFRLALDKAKTDWTFLLTTIIEYNLLQCIFRNPRYDFPPNFPDTRSVSRHCISLLVTSGEQIHIWNLRSQTEM